jgi:hypothetical protein
MLLAYLLLRYVFSALHVTGPPLWDTRAARSIANYFLTNLSGAIPGLTPDMPGAVLALAFRTRQTQGGGVV